MNQKYSKILVTGGAGFIGSHIVDKLLSEDYEVTVLDNLSTGRLENLSHHQDNRSFHFIKGDILDLNLIQRILEHQEVVYHQAALANVLYSVKNPIFTNEVNVKGTLSLLKACINNDVKRFIFASSASVYGETHILPMKETTSLNLQSPYAITKFAAENYIKLYHELYGLETICLRYFNVYGLRARTNQGVISIFINQLLKNQSPIIYGDGEQTRDFINVQDVADANILALSSKNAVGETINIGTGIATSLNQIVNLLLEILNKKYKNPIYSNPRPGDVRHGYADIKEAQELLGFKPNIFIKKGIIQLVEWYRNESQRR